MGKKMTDLTKAENARLKELAYRLNHTPIGTGDAEMAEFDALMVRKHGKGYNIGNV
jgi:hypothetical protein